MTTRATIHQEALVARRLAILEAMRAEDVYVSFHEQIRWRERVESRTPPGRETIRAMQQALKRGVPVTREWAAPYSDQPARLLSGRDDTLLIYDEETAALLFVPSPRRAQWDLGIGVSTVIRLRDRSDGR